MSLKDTGGGRRGRAVVVASEVSASARPTEVSRVALENSIFFSTTTTTSCQVEVMIIPKDLF